MPNLGKKFECFSCRAKFYDLGKPDAVCPKCGANQKDARNMEDLPVSAPRVRRVAPIVVAPDEGGEFEEAGAEEEETIDHPEFAAEDEFADEEPPLETHEREEEEDF